ncbi:MAG: DUF952 domain-containing protein [Phycisphaeraceae bacterium]|nr:DUF952 domain-containing protein [Phycisphaeraceae bacterium]
MNAEEAQPPAPPIFHIASRGQWRASAETGQYAPPEFNADGFVVCSFVDDVADVANAYFQDQTDLVLLRINQEKTGKPVRLESIDPEMKSLPCIFGAVPVEAVTGVFTLSAGPGGAYELPRGLQHD